MKKANKKRIFYFIIVLVFVIGIVLILFMNSEFMEFQKNGNSLISLDGYKEINIEVKDDAIMLRDNCRAIVVNIPLERAHNLEVAKNNITEERPSIYDSTIELMRSFNIELGLVKIEKLENNVFYSKAIFSSKDKILNLDMRPSDAMVLALRLNKPIYINEELLESQARNIC
ncbi:bifunctional nuclease family protein [Candidatus Woesearchaeota archaeon]|nr:bifunctional nuclease family protein [Candidatus Woesearchaeota archaeon]